MIPPTGGFPGQDSSADYTFSHFLFGLIDSSHIYHRTVVVLTHNVSLSLNLDFIPLWLAGPCVYLHPTYHFLFLPTIVISSTFLFSLSVSLISHLSLYVRVIYVACFVVYPPFEVKKPLSTFFFSFLSSIPPVFRSLDSSLMDGQNIFLSPVYR